MMSLDYFSLLFMLEVARPQPLTTAEEPSKREEPKPLIEKMTPETGRAIRWTGTEV